jgi:hypothetical protein
VFEEQENGRLVQHLHRGISGSSDVLQRTTNAGTTAPVYSEISGGGRLVEVLGPRPRKRSSGLRAQGVKTRGASSRIVGNPGLFTGSLNPNKRKTDAIYFSSSFFVAPIKWTRSGTNSS